MEKRHVNRYQRIEWFYSKLRSGELKFDLDFEVLRYNNHSLIELLLLGTKFPYIVSIDSTEEVHIILMGAPYILEVISFIDNAFPVKTTILTELNGKYFRELPNYAKNRLERTFVETLEFYDFNQTSRNKMNSLLRKFLPCSQKA